MKEKELFRDNLERIDRAFPDREILTIGELKRYTGLSDNRTVRKFLKMDNGQKVLSKCQLASRLS